MYIYNKTNKPFSLIFIIKEYNKDKKLLKINLFTFVIKLNIFLI